MRPARSARTCTSPRREALKRSVTAKPELVRLTIGRPVLRSTTPPVGGGIGVPTASNTAVTWVAPFAVTLQVRTVPLHAPPQRPKRAPCAAVAVRTTVAPRASSTEHAFAPWPQVMPPPVTVPGPVTATVSCVVPLLVPPVKVALTLRARVIESVHVLVLPLQASPQPVKVAPDEGIAVSTTIVPEATSFEHCVAPSPQSMPPPDTAPLPVTETTSENVEPVGGGGPWPPENDAVTDFAPSIVTTHVVVVPAQAPPQPLKPAPEPGVAVSVTCVFAASSAEHVDPPAEVQLMPPPLTTPLPVTVTLRLFVAADLTNVAVTNASSLIVTVQLVSVPLHAPPQPSNE